MTGAAKALRGLLHCFLLLTLLAGCGGGGGANLIGTGTNGNGGATLVSVQVSPSVSKIALGTATQVKATGVYSDNTTRDLTGQVTWSSSNTAVASVSNTPGTCGKVSTLAAGTTLIKATMGSVSGSCALSVIQSTLNFISLAPLSPTVAIGTSQQFTATGIFSTASGMMEQDLTAQVAWSSSNGNVSVSNSAGSNGLATAQLAGSATVTASMTIGGNTVTASTLMTVTSANLVSIQVTPSLPGIAAGTTQQFSATALFDDGSKQDFTSSVTWSSSSSSVAAISASGLATGLAAGTTTIKATSGAFNGSTTLTVSAASLVAMELVPLSPSIAVGLPQQFAVVGRFSDNTTSDVSTQATWSSSNSSVATVSNAAGSNGTAIPVAPGTTTISAALAGVTASTQLTVKDSAVTLVSIDVEPAIPSIPAGVQQPMTATGTYSDGSTQDLTASAVWTSDTPAVADISNATATRGVVTSFAPGTATITATLGSISGSTQLTVNTTTLVSIEVDPPLTSIPKGLSQQFTATGIFSDNSLFDLSPAVTWSSSTPGIATISNDALSSGLASTISAGTTTITATLGSVSGSTTLTVLPLTLQSITITPVNGSIALGTTQQFVATGTYSNNFTQDLTQYVTWISSDPGVASISNFKTERGLASALKVGTTNITAALGGLVSPAVALKVSNASLQSIIITPPVAPATTATMAAKTSTQFTATGNFDDGTTQDLSNLVTWNSSSTSVVAISNSTRSKGVATGISTGTATVSAVFRGVTGNANVNVIAASLTGLSIMPANPTIAAGTSFQLQAIGIFNNGLFTQDVTRTSKWSSSKYNVATFNNGFYKRGIVRGVAAGTCTVTVERGSFNGSTTVTVQ
ncbi:MAG TPA: Ig-like domain-containing protein [Geomonas sp.]|nr:Ig-like domain-containing protein [Geomonas sp.]